MSTQVTSLELGFGSSPTAARLRAGQGHEDDLRRLALRFGTGKQRTPSILEVEIDDLLTNLTALASWPAAASVSWEPALAALATDSTRDAHSVAERLKGAVPPGTVHAEDVTALLGPLWKAGLTDFQRRDIAKLLSLRHGANFSVPGAGKTRVGLAVYQALREREGMERLLIVGPKSAYESWTFENQQCLTEPLALEVFQPGGRQTADALIVNYERLHRSVDELGDWLAEKPSVLLLDEAHRMKLGPNGRYGAACLALGPSAKHRYILTGTPAPNGARDLENLFGFVWPGTGRQKVTEPPRFEWRLDFMKGSSHGTTFQVPA